MTAGGFNPLRYRCSDRGCFNLKMRPKIEVFHDCFPGRINFGDVDAEVEINGKFAQLEWKSSGRKVPTGQHIKFQRYTSNDGFAVFVAVGDAELMTVEAMCVYWNGKRSNWTEFTENGIEVLRERIRAWAEIASGQRAA